MIDRRQPVSSLTPAVLARILAASFTLLGTGTFGYSFLEGWSLFDSLYMTVITVSTVGYGEVHPLSDGGRVLTIFIILGGIGLVAYMAGHTATFFLESTGLLRVKKMRQNRIKSSDHVIVCGYDELSQRVCEELKEHVEVVVVAQDENGARQSSDAGLNTILGDATDEGTLRRAGIDKARAVVLMMESDAEAVLAALTIRQENAEVLILSQGHASHLEARLHKAGVNQVINPLGAVGRRIANAIVRPAVVDLMEVSAKGLDPTMRIREIHLREESVLIGKSIRESHIHDKLNILIVGVKKADGTWLYNPPPDLTLQPGWAIIALGPLINLKKLQDICRAMEQGL